MHYPPSTIITIKITCTVCTVRSEALVTTCSDVLHRPQRLYCGFLNFGTKQTDMWVRNHTEPALSEHLPG